MAVKGKIISNPHTGQTIRFIRTSRDTNGALLEMESSFAPYSKEPIPHYHPIQDEVFFVMEGSLSVRINNEVKIFRKGEKVELPAYTIHSMWNHTAGKTIVNWKVQPALQTEAFLETAMGLATDNRVNRKGMPSILQTSLLIKKFSNEIRLAKPSALIQKIVFNALAPVAKLAGYKEFYPEYVDE